MFQLRFLGPVSIATDDQVYAIRSQKVRAALCTLALNARHVVPTEELIDELWGEEPPAKARNALQANILRLRKTMALLGGAGCGLAIRTTSIGYSFEIDPSHIDSEQFQLLARKGRAALRSSPAQAAGLLSAALKLWHGPALCDVGEVRRCRSAAVLLDEQRLLAQGDLMAAQLLAGGARDVIGELHQLVLKYPTQERFCAQLMLALYRCNRQADAVNVFHRARGWLSDELGLEPGPSLRVIYQAIIRQDPSLLLQAMPNEAQPSVPAPGLLEVL